MEEVKVINLWVSPFGMRVLIGLEEKGVKYDYQEDDVTTKKSDLLLETNPVYKKVPVLIHNGKPICESLIILMYIDEVWSSKPFLPYKPYDRTLSRFWADFVDKKFSDSGFRIMITKGEAQEEAKRDMLANLEFLEGALKEMSGGRAPYFEGEEFGFMDIAFIPFASWFHTYESLGNFTLPFQTQFPLLHTWVKICMERESVKKILPTPQRVLEFGLQFRKKFVID